MTAMPAGLVAIADLNWFTIVSGSQFDQTYRTFAPRSAAACFAPLYTLTAKTPPAGPPGKNTIFCPLHHFPANGAAFPLLVTPRNRVATKATVPAATGSTAIRSTRFTLAPSFRYRRGRA